MLDINKYIKFKHLTIIHNLTALQKYISYYQIILHNLKLLISKTRNKITSFHSKYHVYITKDFVIQHNYLNHYSNNSYIKEIEISGDKDLKEFNRISSILILLKT